MVILILSRRALAKAYHLARRLTIKAALAIVLGSIAVAGCSNSGQPTPSLKEPSDASYVITKHIVVQLKPTYINGYLQTGLPTQEDDYTVVYGNDVLKVKYSSSQTNSAKAGGEPETHEHSYDHDPDLDQVPQVGVPIRRCTLSKNITSDGGPIIDTQSTPEPCMIQFGDTLQYEPWPNAGTGPEAYTYVVFDILSERDR